MTKINVVPMDPTAEDLKHPDDGTLGKGASWTYDTYTMRLIMNGVIAIAAAAPATAPVTADAAVPPTAPTDTSSPAATDSAPIAPPAPAAPAAKTK